jgi:hypothetical protein
MYTQDENQIIILGLNMYKRKLAKALKQSEEIHAGEKEVKQRFFTTEKLIEKVSNELKD